MPRPGGNPDFGKKIKFNYGREEALREQVSMRLATQTKLQLQDLAQQHNCSVPDIVREAIAQYLSNIKSKSAV